MTDLNELVVEAVRVTMTAEKVAAAVEAHVNSLIKEAIKSSFDHYSENGKLVKKAVENALRVNDLDIPEYGLMVAQMLKVSIEKHASAVIAEQLSKDMEELLSLAPKTIKLSQIIKDFRADLDGDHGDITLIHEPGEGKYSSDWVCIDSDDGITKTYDCDVRLLINKDGKITAGWLSQKDLKTTKTFGSFHGIDQRLRAYYACGTIIEIDMDNCEIERQWD